MSGLTCPARAIACERGQTTLLVLGLAMVVMAVAGVAVDGTRAFLYRRTLQNAADASALAGAGELNESALYSSGGRTIVLSSGRARAVAASWLTSRGLDTGSIIEAEPSGVHVVLRGTVPTIFLGLVGIDSVPVAVRARAEPIGV